MSLSQLLAWLVKRAAPLTTAMIGIDAVLWSDFRHGFSLPIGSASSSVLSALTAIAAIVISAVACLAIGSAMPGQVLTVWIRRDGPTLAELLRSPVSATSDLKVGSGQCPRLTQAGLPSCAWDFPRRAGRRAVRAQEVPTVGRRPFRVAR